MSDLHDLARRLEADGVPGCTTTVHRHRLLPELAAWLYRLVASAEPGGCPATRPAPRCPPADITPKNGEAPLA